MEILGYQHSDGLRIKEKGLKAKKKVAMLPQGQVPFGKDKTHEIILKIKRPNKVDVLPQDQVVPFRKRKK